MYKEAYLPARLSLVKGTPDVPADGYYYVVREGAVLLKSKSLREARKEFLRLRSELGGSKTLGPHDIEEARQRLLAEIDVPKTYKKRKYKPGSTNTFG